MSKKSLFIPAKDNIYKMKPVAEGDLEYGYEIFKLYDESFSHDLSTLFRQGISGMVFGESKPISDAEVRSVLNSGILCRPEDQDSIEKGGIRLSPGQFACCARNGRFDNPGTRENRSLRWFTDIRLQGDYKELLQDDYPQEETGTMAVSVANTLAINGIFPGNKQGDFLFHRITIAGMSEDDKHEHPWIAVEFDIRVKSKMIFPTPPPHDNATGYVPISAIRDIIKRNEMDGE